MTNKGGVCIISANVFSKIKELVLTRVKKWR